MRVAPPALLPILRSRVQGAILAATYLDPGREFTVTELAAQAGAGLKAVAQEVDRLVRTGFLADRRRGNMRLVRRGAPSRVTAPLTDLLAATYGPLSVLEELLGEVDGIDEAWIYGSWAARYSGQPGAVPGDIDVIVVGTPSLADLDDVASAAAARLGREVNVHRVSLQAWASPDPRDTFLATIRTRPLVSVPLRAPSLPTTEKAAA